MEELKFFFRNLFDAHVHFRQGKVLEKYVPATSNLNSGALVMPNTDPPICTAKEAAIYRNEIMHCIGKENKDKFTPYMTVYVTAKTNPKDVYIGFNEGVFLAAKLYPPHGTTGSQHAPHNLEDVFPLFEMMEQNGMPLCIHGEMQLDVEGIDTFDSERMFLEQKLPLILKYFPNLHIVMEHVTTKEMAEFVATCDYNIRATITPQHLLLHRNHMLASGFRAHLNCKPILKRKEHRDYIQNLIIQKHPRFGLGSDSAPHANARKYSKDSCAGVFSAPVMHEMYFSFFYEKGITDHYQAFASDIMTSFYGIQVPERKFAFRHIPNGWRIPSYHNGDDYITSLGDGELIFWKAEVAR